MAMNSDQPPNSELNANGENDPLAEARDLIERLLEERMTPAEAARFETLGRDIREVRRLYLQTMNMVSNLPHYVASHEWILGDEMTEAREVAKPSMGEAMVLPAMREQDLADNDPPPLRMPEPPPARPVPVRTPWGRWATAAAAVVAVSLLGWGVFRPRAAEIVVIKPQSTQPAVTPVIVEPPVVVPPKLVHLAATAGTTWADGVAIRPGTVLEPGRRVSLVSGAVEVQFETGVRVVVEGPAAFRVTDENHANLEYGKLVARVQPSGRGFGVQFSDRIVTDLGTEFGLSATSQHAATVSVFEGEVVVDQTASSTAAASTQPATQPVAPLHLMKGQVVTATETAHDWVPANPVDVHFARTLDSVRLPIPTLTNTGVGLREGDPDPRWLQFKESAGETTAKPAAMMSSGAWTSTDPARSQWLSVGGNRPSFGAGVFIFRTTFDLTGFDPKTVAIEADVMTDDALNDIRVNGVSAGVSMPLAADRQNWRRFHRLPLRGPFKAGQNTLEFLVYNGSAVMGMRAELRGTAAPLAVR